MLTQISDKAIRILTLSILGLVTLVAVGVGYQLFKAQYAVEVYRDRVKQMAADYGDLMETYNQAVRKTAVTELVVEDGSLCVHVRTAEGVDRTVATPFDPAREIFVDYVVLDGRLWIRRIYDDHTRPSEGLVIDPAYETVDWSDPKLRQGKVVYRSLTEGRWIVTVTGGGSLGLAKVSDTEFSDLAAPPHVRDYPQIEREVQQEVDAVGPGDVFKRLVGVEGG
jgi:hypothetical protein